MNNTSSPHPESSIALRVREVQVQWSSQERHRRAAAGRRLSQELLRQISEVPDEPEIWAVGALDDADLQRLAG